MVSYQWKVSPHARLGYLWNTNSVLIPTTQMPMNGITPSPTGGSSQLPGGLQYDIGADWAALKKLTVAGDFLGNQFLNSPSLILGTQTIPTTPSTTPSTLTPVKSSYTVDYLASAQSGDRWET